VYIRIAKDKKQKKAARKRLLQGIEQITQQLDKESANEQELLEQWTERILSAQIEDKKLILAVSELRVEQCESVLRSFDRTKKVMEAVLEALTEKIDQRQTG
jgi:hypothetical protein